jgi:hypothetical protein
MTATDAAPDKNDNDNDIDNNINVADNNPVTNAVNHDRPVNTRPMPANDPGSIPLEVSDDMATLVSNDLTAELGDFHIPILMVPLGRPTVSTGGIAPPPPSITQRVASRDGHVRYLRPGQVASRTIARTGERSRSTRNTGAMEAEATAATKADSDVATLTLPVRTDRGTKRGPEVAAQGDTNELSKLPPYRTNEEGSTTLALSLGVLTPIDNTQPLSLRQWEEEARDGSDANVKDALPPRHIGPSGGPHSSSTTTPTRPGRLQFAGRLTAHPGAFSVDGPTTDVASINGPAPLASITNDQIVVNEPSNLVIRASLVPEQADQPVVVASPWIQEQALQNEPPSADPSHVVISRKMLKILALIATVIIVAFGVGLGVALFGQGSEGEVDYPKKPRPPPERPPPSRPPQESPPGGDGANQTNTFNSFMPTTINTSIAPTGTLTQSSPAELSTLPSHAPSLQPSSDNNNTNNSNPWGGGGGEVWGRPTGGTGVPNGAGGGRPDGGGGGRPDA